MIADPGLTRLAADNRRRAIVLLLAAGAGAGLVVGLVSVVVVAPLVALVIFMVVTAAACAAGWWGCEPLARRLIGARAADPAHHARLYNLVDGLCVSAGLPAPALHIVDDDGLNALSMGHSPRRASLVVTRGLVEQLSRIELEAVVAHELAHIKSDDILTATVAVALFGIFGAPARAAASGGIRAAGAILLVPVSALAGLGLRAAAAPQREERADLSGVALTRYPPAMVAALEKLQGERSLLRRASPATAHLWLGAPAAAPAGDRLRWLTDLFETHPPIGERIQALREL